MEKRFHKITSQDQATYSIFEQSPFGADQRHPLSDTPVLAFLNMGGMKMPLFTATHFGEDKIPVTTLSAGLFCFPITLF